MEQNSSPISHSSMMTNLNYGSSAEASISSMSTSLNVPSVSPSSPPQREFIIDAANQFSNMSSPSNPSLDSFQFSQLLQISEHQKNPPNVFENNVYSYPIQDSSYIDDTNTNNYSLEGLNQDPMSTMETYDISQFDFQTAGNGWMLDNMVDPNLWNMDAM